MLCTPTKMSGSSKERLGCTSIKELKAKDPGREFTPLTSHLTTGDTSLDDLLGILKPEVATVSPVNVRTVEELDFDTTNVVALFKKNNHKVYLCVEILSNILWSSVRVFDTAARPNIICTSITLVKWRNLIRPIQNMSLQFRI